MQLKKEIKFETLRKSHKKQIIIGSVLVCVVGSILTFNLTKAKYRLTQSMKLVTGTINYKVPDMRVVAVNISEDGTNYEIANDIPESGYILNEEKSICRVSTETSGIENAPKDENITIEYVNGLINFRGITKRNTRCYLYFDKKKEPTSDNTLANLGIDESKIADQTDTIPDFSKTATTNEGIFRTDDGMYGGKSVYWRGAATTNHVIFANKCWRIIRINGDGTIRLIYNGAAFASETNQYCSAGGSNSGSIAKTEQAYNLLTGSSEYVGYTYTVGEQRPNSNKEIKESNLKTQTESWFNMNITETNLENVTDGKFCNDRNLVSGTWESQPNSYISYASGVRLSNRNAPTLSCNAEDIYILKAGAITADEVAFAGGTYDIANSSYYLYNYRNYWTMTPRFGNDSSSHVFVVTSTGEVESYAVVINTTVGIRPVINLRSDVTFNSGSDGTYNNPYIVQ